MWDLCSLRVFRGRLIYSARMNRASRVRSQALWVALVAVLAFTCGGCQFLQNEFFVYDVAAPAEDLENESVRP